MQGGYTIKKKMGRGDMSVSPKTEIDGEHDITTPQTCTEVPKIKFLSEIIGLWFKNSLLSPPYEQKNVARYARM